VYGFRAVHKQIKIPDVCPRHVRARLLSKGNFMQTNNSNTPKSSPDGAPQSGGALDQAILTEEGLPPAAADASSDQQADEGEELDPRKASAAVAASAYGAYALHVTITEMDALAAKVIAFATRLSELRRHAGVPDCELTQAGGAAYHGLNNIFEDLRFTELSKDYAETGEQLGTEMQALIRLLPDNRDTFQVVGDMHAARHGAAMLHNATEKVELAREVASADHDEIFDKAKKLQGSEYEPFSLRAVSGLKSATDQFTAAQAVIGQAAMDAHHALLEAVDHSAIACGTYDSEMAISLEAIHVAVPPNSVSPTAAPYTH
jgi:hypothetical protein